VHDLLELSPSFVTPGIPGIPGMTEVPAGGAEGVPIVNHEPHHMAGRDELVAHLVARHCYSREMIQDAGRSYLETAHVRSHHRMVEDPPATAEELAGTAERLSASAMDTLEALRPLDRGLAVRLAGRWAAALDTLTGGR
jgi:hypothetical protein